MSNTGPTPISRKRKLLPGEDVEGITLLLSKSLGDHAARDVVARALREADLRSIDNYDEFLAVLHAIEKQGGTAGLAARLALSRSARGVSITEGTATDPSSNANAPIGTPSPPPVRPVATPSATQTGERSVSVNIGKTIEILEITKMLAHSLGDVKAEAVVATAVRVLRISGTVLTHSQATDVLDHLVGQGGVVATVARFTKVRFLLEGTSARK